MSKEMNEKKKARVVEILLDKYILKLEDNTYIKAILKGNLKKKSSVIVGDFVEVEMLYEKYVITNVLSRKNFVIRPLVANIDQLVIVMALSHPKPDYMLLDKQLILCAQKGIVPILCINKIDLSNDNYELQEELEYIKSTYASLVQKMIFTSSTDNIGLDKLNDILLNKTSAFSGNSGVGKSSLTRAILESYSVNSNISANEDLKKIEIGAIGSKTKKGKHTTKYVKLYSLESNTYIFDTPGFSSYELYDIDYRKIKDYYKDFKKYKCDFEDCNHVNESESVCAIKKEVARNNIDNLRYERYVNIFLKLKEVYDKKYK